MTHAESARTDDPDRLDRNRRRRARQLKRDGMSVVVIMSLVSLALAMSYIALRSQGTTMLMGSNSNLDNAARQAAMTGFSMTLRKMSQTDWGGVSSTVSGSLSSTQTFAASFTTGDPTLTSSSANYSDFPYRVTVSVLGVATDPARPTISAKHTVTAVVRLMPAATPSDPATMASALNYTLYQTGNGPLELQLPCQVRGAVWGQGNLSFCGTYPPQQYGLAQYLSDLNTMRTSGYNDMRPLTSTLYIPNNRITNGQVTLITTTLGAAVSYTSSTTATNWNFPSSISNYALFPGGQTYSATALNSSISNTSLSPNIKTNPLGLFTRNGSLTIGSNVSVTGTIVCSSGITITGSNVYLQAASEPALTGSASPVQLPVIVGNSDLNVGSNASATIRGMVALWGNLDVTPGSSSTALDFKGRLLVNGFRVEQRNDWNLGNAWWSFLWTWFNQQLSPPTSSTIPYYPVYLNYWGLNPQPILTFTPEASSVNYQWKDNSNTVYVPASSDPGLRWTVLSWSMN